MSTTNETIIEQIPASVRDFSSQYGPNHSRSYTVDNICSEVEIYPLYGDSTNALVFRTYGPWWINLPSYKENKRQLSRQEIEFNSRDFVEIEYGELIGRCTSLNIYETYNPGTLEVVYAGKEENDGTISWHRVWKFPEPFSIILRNNEEIFVNDGQQRMKDLFPDHVNTATAALESLKLNTDHGLISKIRTKHTYPAAARLSRILKIPLENKIPFPTRHIRLEFDHCTAHYYIEIDTIKLCGYRSPIDLPVSTVNKPIEKQEEIIEDNSPTNLTTLPFDLLFLICSYLDLPSLVRLSSTCRFLHEKCLNSLQFLSMDLQPYWNRINNASIENFFLDHCAQTRFLSLAWTQSIDYSPFTELLSACPNNLVQLNLGCCRYLDGKYIEAIVESCPNIEILNLESCIQLNTEDFIPLRDLLHLRSLNVYRTTIDYQTLLPLINNNKEHFESLNIGGCQYLADISGITRLLFGRCSNLRTVDLWRQRPLTPYDFFSLVGFPMNAEEESKRISALTPDQQEDLMLIYSMVNMPFQIESLNHLNGLREIDLGWTTPPAGFIRVLVHQAGHSLIKILLTACRHVSHEDIIAISKNCPELRQLDVLGVSGIVEESIENILQHCPHIEFIDLSFCNAIRPETISDWIRNYKNCFKQSYQPITNDDVYFEFP